MLKGYIAPDQDTVALGLLGAAAGIAAGQAMGKKGKKGKKATGYGALAGLAVALGLRAAVDPKLKAERAATA